MNISVFFLSSMKREFVEICEEIKLVKVKLVEDDKILTRLRRERDNLRVELAGCDRDLEIDVDQCLPLKDQVDIDTRGSKPVHVPIKHGP